MFTKTKKVKMLIAERQLLYLKDKYFRVYILNSKDGRFHFKVAEPTELYLGSWKEDGIVGKYVNHTDNDGLTITSYVDCIITYTRFRKRIISAKVEDKEIYRDLL